MRLFRIFKNIDGVLYAPYHDYEYGRKDEIIGKTFFCDMFDDDPDNLCSRGFYGFDVIGIVRYTDEIFNSSHAYVLAEIEASERIVEISDFKIRCEKMKIIRYYEGDEILPLLDEISCNLFWDLKGIYFPTHPHDKEPEDIELALDYLAKLSNISDWIMKDLLIEQLYNHTKYYFRLRSFFASKSNHPIDYWYTSVSMIDAYIFRCFKDSFIIDTAAEEEQFKECKLISGYVEKIMDLGYIMVCYDGELYLYDKYGNKHKRR